MRILICVAIIALVQGKGLVIIKISPQSEKMQCSYQYSQCLRDAQRTLEYQMCGEVLLKCVKQKEKRFRRKMRKWRMRMNAFQRVKMQANQPTSAPQRQQDFVT